MNAPDAALLSGTTIPLAFITPSPTNPRKRFDPKALAELTESILKHGVIQPVIVRSGHSAKDARILWELVAGERRYRAAKAAGLEEIPAIVRSLTDAEALELQVIENLQREDLHALEEAEGYELLMHQHHYSAEDLAAKVGKSKAYVYARLKLTALTPKAREAFYADKLNPSTALLIARIPVPRLQDEALKEVITTSYDGSLRHSFRSAAAFLQQHYMLRLADAPFPPADEKLLPKVGPCAGCPKRTGNQPELFGDVKGADVCTDPECFAAKKAAHLARMRAAAAAKGQRVISGKEAKKIIPYSSVAENSGYLALDQRNYADPKHRTYRALLGKGCPEPILIEHPESGELIEAVASKEIAGVLKEKIPTRTGAGDEQKKNREAKARLETTINTRVFEAIAAAHPGTMTPADAALIAGALFERTEYECSKMILRLWEPEAFAKAKDKLWELKNRFAKRIAGMTPPELTRLMVQIALVPEVRSSSWSTAKPIHLAATATRLGIDHALIRKEAVSAKAKNYGKAAKVAKPVPRKKTPK